MVIAVMAELLVQSPVSKNANPFPEPLSTPLMVRIVFALFVFNIDANLVFIFIYVGLFVVTFFGGFLKF